MMMVEQICCRMWEAVARLLGRQRLARLLARLIAAHARRLPADEALRLLFDLDSRLYELQGELSVAYGGGLHTKHRHTRYHDFFCDRVRDGEQVLDLGCGMGAVAHAVATRRDVEVVGIDLDPANIAKARERFPHPRVTYLVGDVREYSPGRGFDLVILSNVLEHLTDRVRLLAEVRQALAPARFLVRVPCFERDWRVPLKRELGTEWRLDLTHEIEYTLESFQAEIEAAGLKVVHLEVRWGEIWSELCPK